MEIHARNVNDALAIALRAAKLHGASVISRGKETLEIPGVVNTIYQLPTERVLIDRHRDANPFFHLFESFWILAGSNRLAVPKHFLPSYAQFSDNGRTLHGAYGFRMRCWDKEYVDQLSEVVDLLKAKPDTRQAVVSIWNPALDLGTETKDMPCNDMVMFKIRKGRLNMTVNNRSNDIIWGAYGANAVQFSVLQEWVAARVGVAVGTYTQVSDSLHVYTDLPLWGQFLSGEWVPPASMSSTNPYLDAHVYASPLFLNEEDAAWASEDAMLLCRVAETVGIVSCLSGSVFAQFKSHAFRTLLLPLLVCWQNHKVGDRAGARKALEGVHGHDDWKLAVALWLDKRYGKEQA